MSGLRQIGIDLDVHRVIESNRGTFEESENDILRRLLLPASPSLAAPKPANSRGEPDLQAFAAPPAGTRNTGRWTVEMLGQKYPEPNLKGAYRKALLLLSARYPDFLSEFAAEGGRARKFVARAPDALFLASPALAAKHAAPLVDGWFFDTNLSTDQVARRVRVAARLCGLRYGPDLRLLNNFEQI